MIGIQKNTKRFSLGTFSLVFFFAFSIYFIFNNDPVYAQAPTEAEVEAAAKPLALPINTSSETFNNAAKFLNQTPVEAAGNIVIQGFKWLLYGIFTFCSFLAMIAASIFSYVLDVSHFQAIMSNAVIWEMWKVVRDFFNLFFIFGLLLVAFSTIFQVSKFGGLKSIWNIVLAALFINFSFPITRMIIDVGNVMMYSFINDIFGMTKDSLNSGILSTSGLKGLFLLSKFESGLDVEYYLIAIVCMFMFGVSFLTLALMMFYRLFMLPILIMFSPIGFAGSAIPGFGGYSKQWWDKLIKNVFFGPIAVFMMMIAVKFLQVLASSDMNIAGKNAITANAISSSTSGVSGTLISSIVYMAIPIIFFWIAITSAEKMSSEASGMANSFGSKFLKWSGGLPWRGTKGVAGWAGRKVESKLAKGNKTKYFAPSVWRKAWEDRSKEKEHHDKQAIDQAAGRVHDQMNDVISRFQHPIKTRLGFKGHGKDVTNNEFEQVQRLTSEKRKEISDVSTNGDYVINELQHAINEGDSVKAEAALQILAKNNDLNDMLMEVGKRYVGMKDAKGNNIVDVDAAGNVVVSSKNMNNVLQQVMGGPGVSQDILTKKMVVLGDHATGAGNFAFGGMTKFDAALNDGRGGFKIADQTEQAKWAASKVKNLETQERQRRIHPDSVFTRTATGFGDINGEVGAAIIGTFTNGDVGECKRSRDDMKQAVYDGYQGMKAGGNPKFKSLYDGNTIFKKYVDTMVAFKTAPGATSSTPTPTASSTPPTPPSSTWTTSPGANP